VAQADADGRNASQRIQMNGRRAMRTSEMRWHPTARHKNSRAFTAWRLWV
jgi:hypothetical protein